MALIVNTNVSSLSAQRSLNRNSGALGTSLQRLASGLRINSAKDDAAGLAISSRMTTQIRGLNQAARNANDGISLAQTAEGALGEMTNAVQRLRELAIQSANATNSAADRAGLNSEAQQLIAEIDLIATTTEFNGLKLLDGTFGTSNFHVGANANQTIGVTMTNAKTTSLGIGYTYSQTGTAVAAALTAGDLTINGTDVGAVARDAQAQSDAINSLNLDGVTASAAATTVTGAAITGFADLAAGDIQFTIDGVTYNVGAVTGATDVDTQGAGIEAAINATANLNALVTASYDAGTDVLTVTGVDGKNITTTLGGAATAANTGFTSGATTYSTVTVGLTSATSTDTLVIGGNNVANAGLTAGTFALTSNGATVAGIDISTVSGANAALDVADRALDVINSNRATLGAVQSRFESTINRLTTTSENLSAARSRIQDADFAAETAQLTRNQILQQAGVAILAQANQQPQLALQLLQ
jgi:flagellin